MPTILFSQLPAGHVAVVVAERTTTEDVSEVFLRLADVPTRGGQAPKSGRIYSRRIRAESAGALITEEQVARGGADFANGELGGHDPHAWAFFPVDEEASRYVVRNLRPALAGGRDFLMLIARDSLVPAVKAEASQLAGALAPVPHGEIELQKVGVESELVAMLKDDSGGFGVRAKFRLATPLPPEALPPGDGLEVLITARVYRSLAQYGLPPTPDAEGPEERRTALLNEWSVVDLKLPGMAANPTGYFVVAKVRSRDSRYRREFEPSGCLVAKVVYPF